MRVLSFLLQFLYQVNVSLKEQGQDNETRVLY
jgi:hypothetical protein